MREVAEFCILMAVALRGALVLAPWNERVHTIDVEAEVKQLTCLLLESSLLEVTWVSSGKARIQILLSSSGNKAPTIAVDSV